MTALIRLHEIPEKLALHLAYATAENFTSKQIYQNAHCYIHKEAHEKLMTAAEVFERPVQLESRGFSS